MPKRLLRERELYSSPISLIVLRIVRLGKGPALTYINGIGARFRFSQALDPNAR